MKPKRILIIDDDETLTSLYRTVLESAPGFLVREENNGASALATAKAFRPDLIFLDCNLPDTSGLAIATTLRCDSALAAVPIVFITGEVVRVGGAGCWFLNECPLLPKPFSIDELLRMACAVLGRETQLAA